MYAPHTSRQRTRSSGIRGPDRVEQRPRAQQRGRARRGRGRSAARASSRLASCEKNFPAESTQLRDRVRRSSCRDVRSAAIPSTRSHTAVALQNHLAPATTPRKKPGGPRSIWTPRRVREVGAQFPDRQGRVSPSQAFSKPRSTRATQSAQRRLNVAARESLLPKQRITYPEIALVFCLQSLSTTGGGLKSARSGAR